MPSIGEIFTVSGVGGIEVSKVSEVSKVAGVSEVCDVGAGVAVGEGGMTALWQAARIKIKRSGMIFFIELYFVGQAFSPTSFENANTGGLKTRPTEPVTLPFLPGLRKNWDSLYRPFARL